MEFMKIKFITLGCKANQFDTQALQKLLNKRGHGTANDVASKVDAVVINTCTVTGESGRKSRAAIRRLQKSYPMARIAVRGCLPQVSPDAVSDLGVDLIAGSGDLAAFIEQLETLHMQSNPAPTYAVLQPREVFEPLPAGSADGRTRALLKVQDGCDNHCTYCIIPKARGRGRSMPLHMAVQQAKSLAVQGFREIVLTGVEVAAYGRDLDEECGFVDLTAAICAAVPEMRVRLSSLEPRIVTSDFCTRLRDCANLCPHFHLSLQSGADATLRRMGRRYDTARYLESVEHLRAAFADCAITTDLIVGFPGESESEFAETLQFMQTVGFAAIHVFSYSTRPGTKAADMPNQLTNAEKKHRAGITSRAARDMQQDFWLAQTGKVFPVLFEQSENGKAQGYTPNYCLVTVAGDVRQNEVHMARINGVTDNGLAGALYVCP